MKIKYILFIRLIILSLLVLLKSYNFAYSEILKKIDVKGNDRLAKETIILFSELNINEDIKSENLNTALKKLYDTDYFKDVKMSIINGNLIISVKENPLIQSIKIEGIKNKSIVDDLKQITKKIEKYPYLENKIKEQQNILINIMLINLIYGKIQKIFKH